MRRLLTFSLLAAVTLTACASADGTASEHLTALHEPLPPLSSLAVLDDPRAHEGPSTAVLHDTSIRPVVEDAEPRLPVTVTDHDGREVTVADASRILPLDVYGTIGATVFALGLGDRVVGRDSSTEFPEAAHLPVVTQNGHELNAEAILELAPSVVITDRTVGPSDVLLQLEDVGVPVVIVDSHRDVDSAGDLALEIAAALGVTEEGRMLAERLRTEIADKAAEIGHIAPEAEARVRIVFLYVRGNAGVYYLFGEGSGVDSLVHALGAVDVAGELGWEGMRPVTAEALVEMQPDLILMMTSGLDSVDGVEGLIERVPAIAATRAGEHRRIVDMDDHAVLGFGPRTPDVLDALARAIYAPEGTR